MVAANCLSNQDKANAIVGKTKTIPAWFNAITGAVECLSLSEAKDILTCLLPGSPKFFRLRNSLIAKSKGIQYEIIANGMRHKWSEDHCTDEIVISAFREHRCLLSQRFKLGEVKSVDEILSRCKISC